MHELSTGIIARIDLRLYHNMHNAKHKQLLTWVDLCDTIHTWLPPFRTVQVTIPSNQNSKSSLCSLRQSLSRERLETRARSAARLARRSRTTCTITSVTRDRGDLFEYYWDF